jgi:UDP-glucose:tetrahydrobiopterin glucosyltransferase
VAIPADALLPRLWQRALEHQARFDCILNLAYDWLPFWLSRHTLTPLCHLVSMGSVAQVMDEVIESVAVWRPELLAFHTASQASDFRLPGPPRLVGNGFDLDRYQPLPATAVEPALGWAGRISPEKGLEDAALVAARLGLPLRVWGLREDGAYADAVERSVPAGTIDWRGFQPTDRFQAELARCRVFLNTPKWNEAYGNVVVEALACGVPVVAYRRGGPGELVQPGLTGQLVEPDDVTALAAAVAQVGTIERRACRAWVEAHASRAVLAQRVEAWLLAGLGL